MNFEITELARQKLQRRLDRLQQSDGRFLQTTVSRFFSFLENEPLLSGIFAEIKSQFPQPENPHFDQIFNDSNHPANLRNIKMKMTF